ncbi:hypothetical protein CSA56_07125 [candidate division KSB3 bacterium]|uniref:Lcl C-terminal domain-containing protein n=1 Tax=candidate division KSB3 bacterium TaxID=2044937 RepID=A0A2G6KG52_9BACT|nr:MAG: hypothetical protein CSA56_07125 [candidate division KSB3 bacterium]
MNLSPKRLRYVFYGFLVLTGGCHHPQALYEEAPRSPLERGREYEQHHRYDYAQQQYLQIDDVVTRNMTLNQLLAAWESVNAAITTAQQRVHTEPRKASARLTLARAYYHKGLLCTRYSRETQGDYPKDFIADEQEYYYSQAYRQAQKAIRLNKHLPEAYLLIGEIYLANLRYNDALKELKRLIVQHQDYARGYYAIGKIYLKQKEYAKVERYLIRSIKLAPDDIDAYYLLGQYYIDRGWYEYAAYTFLEILRRNPSDAPAFDLLVDACHELGNYYVAEGQYDRAIQLFQAILDVRSSYPVHQSLLLAKKTKSEVLSEPEQAADQSPETTGSPRQSEPKPTAAIEPVLEQAADETLPEIQPPTAQTPEQSVPDNIEPIQLRQTSASLSNTEIIRMIDEYGFHHPHSLETWGLARTVKGDLRHAYEPHTANDVPLVLDHATGLMWQQSGSDSQMNWAEAKTYVQQLNRDTAGGYADWRLPTIEELASLLEFEQKNGELYIDPVFAPSQSFCWSADSVMSSNAAWAVAFNSGHVYYDDLNRENFVRAVRVFSHN